MVLGVLAYLIPIAQASGYTKDLDELISSAEVYGAYVQQDRIDFARIRKTYRPRLQTVKSRDEALAVFEDVLGELHDFHASLSTNDDSSPKLVPSGTDILATWHGGKAFVSQVREGSDAERLGVRYGDEILGIGKEGTRAAAEAWLHHPIFTSREGYWALNSATAGRWNVPRVFKLRRGSKVLSVEIPTYRPPKAASILTVTFRKDGILILRPENSLGDDELIRRIDKEAPMMRKARGIVLDLRNTPGGGNSNVARAVMGLFISKRLPFQRHRVEERNTNTVRDWVEYATPRLAEPIRAKLVVLVGGWTGSMGEGLAIGFDGMHRGTVVGAQMAGLRGAVDSVELPSLGCRAFFPTEQVFHVNGTPRHEWMPPVKVRPTSGAAFMQKGVELLLKGSGRAKGKP